MRRGVASLLMGMSLILASTGWAGLVLSSNILDDDNSEALAQQVLRDSSVQAVLMTRIRDGMSRIVPDDETMSRQELEAAAETAFHDRATIAVLEEALADAHRRGLAGEEVDGFFTHFDSNEAARQALIEERPSLRQQILVNPLVRIVLPTSGLTWLSGLKPVINRLAIIAIAAGIIGFAAAFTVARDATATMRRAAWWILGAGAFWTIVSMVLGAALRAAAPSSYVLLASVIESFFASMRVPAIIMTTFGLGMLAASLVVPMLERRRGGYVLARAQNQSVSFTEPHAFASGMAPTRREAMMHRVGSLSADWKEGHGYLDDARVAPFISQTLDPATEASTTVADRPTADSGSRLAEG